jgi:hypothetical protein
MLEQQVKEVMTDLIAKRMSSFKFTGRDLLKIQRQCKALKCSFVDLAESDTYCLIYMHSLKRFVTGLADNALVIVSDYKPKEIISGYDLTDKEKKDYDFLEPDELDSSYSFFRVSGQVYYLGNFMKLDGYRESETRFWDGAEGTSYFSSNLVKYNDSGDSVYFASSYQLG